MSGDDGAGKLGAVLLLDEGGHLGGCEELLLLQGLLDELLYQHRLLVLSFALSGGDEGACFDLFVGPELAILMQDGGIPQFQEAGYLFEGPGVPVASVFVVDVLGEYPVHREQLLLGDDGPHLPLP